MSISSKAVSSSFATSTTTANGAYPLSTSKYVRVLNMSTGALFVNSGNSSVTATTANQFIGPNITTILERDANDTHLAAILSTGTGTVYFTPCAQTEV